MAPLDSVHFVRRMGMALSIVGAMLSYGNYYVLTEAGWYLPTVLSLGILMFLFGFVLIFFPGPKMVFSAEEFDWDDYISDLPQGIKMIWAIGIGASFVVAMGIYIWLDNF